MIFENRPLQEKLGIEEKSELPHSGEPIIEPSEKLPDIVRDRLIKHFGDRVFSFTDLVNFSLYEPELGYYSGKNAGIGLFGAGDRPLVYSEIDGHSAFMDKIADLHKENPESYKTPVEIHSPYFGIGVAREMEVLLELGSIKPVVYEIGAGRATLAKDILDYWKMYNPELYQKVKYRILDASPKLIASQRERLGEHSDKVEWIEGDARNIPFANHSIEGVLVNTELLDNLPVACIKRKRKGQEGQSVDIEDFVEIGYQMEDGKLVEKEVPLSEEVRFFIKDNPELLLPKSNTTVPRLDVEVDGRAYLGTGSRKFYQELARVFKKGYVVSFDYCSLPSEKEGDYMAMSVHRGAGELSLEKNIGQADIYFSVDCWAINRMARKNGFQKIQFDFPQGQFFRRVYEGDVYSEDNANERRQLLFKGDKYGPPPLITDFSNTFALVHSIGLGDYPKLLYEKQREIIKRHQLKREDLTLGRTK